MFSGLLAGCGVGDVTTTGPSTRVASFAVTVGPFTATATGLDTDGPSVGDTPGSTALADTPQSTDTAPSTNTTEVTASTGAGPTSSAEPATAAPSRTPESTPTSAISTRSSTTPTTTTPPPAAPPVTGRADGRVVVLDAGHNGANAANPAIINAPVDAGFGQTKACNTTGTQTNAGYPEHAFNWELANRVREYLQAAGVTVVMTRDSDDGVGPCVNKRAAIGNDRNADAVVSIHGDGSSAGNRGFYAMTSQRAPNGAATAARSVGLATAIRDALVDGGVAASNYVGSNGLWKRDDLAGLNLSVVPTTMIEMGNMRDSTDAELMKSVRGQDQMAAGIARGVLAYLAG